MPQRESASVPSGNPAGLESVTLVPQPNREAIVQLSFSRTVKYRIIMDTNSRHLRLDVASPAAAGSCLGAASADDGSSPESDEASKSDGVPGARDPSTALKEGKKLLAAKKYPQAIALFTRAIDTGKGDTRQQAMETLGLARERAGQLPHAKAVYEDYLKTYTSGEGAARVKERLAASSPPWTTTPRANLMRCAASARRKPPRTSRRTTSPAKTSPQRRARATAASGRGKACVRPATAW